MKRTGFTVLNTIVSMVIIASVILLVLNFNKYTYKTLDVSNHELMVLEKINNKITELYILKDWGLLEAENIKIGNSALDIKYTYKDKTQYNTEKLGLEVTYQNKTKEYNLERNKTE